MDVILDCVGRVHDFSYNSLDFYDESAGQGYYWNFPNANFFDSINNLIFISSFVLPLVGYGKIFW